MSERLRESLSALMDDEADDLELGRILREMAQEESELHATWSRYQLVSAVLQGQSGLTGLRTLSFDALDPEEAETDGHLPDTDSRDLDSQGSAHAAAGGWHSRPWRALTSFAAAASATTATAVTSFAVAASVTAVAVVGWQWLPGAEPGAASMADSPVSAPARPTDRRILMPAAQPRLEALPRQTAAAPESNHSPAPQQGSRVDSARQVEGYMLRHAEHNALHSRSGMMPFARMAAFDGAQ